MKSELWEMIEQAVQSAEEYIIVSFNHTEWLRLKSHFEETDTEIAKRMIEQWLKDLPCKDWKTTTKHNGVLISERVARIVTNEIIVWLAKE